MCFERRRDSSLRSPTDGRANGSETWSPLVRASLKLAAGSINFPHQPSCMTPLGDGSPSLCGSCCGSSARTTLCSFRLLESDLVQLWFEYTRIDTAFHFI